MKNIFLIFTLFLFSMVANAQMRTVDKQEILFKNFYTPNSGFEQGLKDVTVSGATKSLESTLVRSGSKSLHCNITTTNHYCELKLVTLPGAAQHALAVFWYYTTSATIKVELMDSANTVINSVVPLAANTGFNKISLPYAAVAATSYKLRFTQTANSNNNIYIDDIYQGEDYSYNLPSIPGSYAYSGYFPNSTTNYWTRTGTSYADFTEVGTVPTPTTFINSDFGTVTIATGDLPGIKFTAPRSGIIKVTTVISIIPGVAAGAATWAIKVHESNTATDISGAGGSITKNDVSLMQIPITTDGYFQATLGTEYIFKVQASISTGTMYIGGAAAGACLTFSIHYIS